MNKLPQWWNEVKYATLILTDDIDSLFACAILNHYKGWEIGRFYDFNSLYELDDMMFDNMFYDSVGVDCALVKGKCIDNHVTRNYRDDYLNKESINLNSVYDISCENYTSKYCGSTVLEVLSLCGFTNEDMDALSEEQKMFLLSIDGTYIGFYKGFKYTNKKFLDILGFPCLYEVEQRHTKNEFEDISDKYNTNKRGKIFVEDGKLQTTIDVDAINKLFADTPFHLELPTCEVTLEKQFKTRRYTPYGEKFLKHITNRVEETMFSYAFTYKNSISYTAI